MLSKWKKEAVDGMPSLFRKDSAKKRKEGQEREAQLDELYTQIGKLTTQLEWLKKNLAEELTSHERRHLVDMDGTELPVSTQAELLGMNRTGLYYHPVPPSSEDLAVKKRIDRIYTAHPEFGYRRICAWLNRYEDIHINHKAVLRHMREMGIQAIYPRHNTSRPAPEQTVYPYLLNNLTINHPNHVWSIDITYVPIRSSWLYLVAVIDWFSRYVLSWQMDDTLELPFVPEACRLALHTAVPEIMNSDQGAHFTSPQYVNLFLNVGSKISMDHRGRAYDNIFIERLWRSVKYENIYLQEYDSPRSASKGISIYFNFYNSERLHQSLGYRNPQEVYFKRNS